MIHWGSVFCFLHIFSEDLCLRGDEKVAQVSAQPEEAGFHVLCVTPVSQILPMPFAKNTKRMLHLDSECVLGFCLLIKYAAKCSLFSSAVSQHVMNDL